MPDTNLLEKLCLVGDNVAGDPTHFMIQRALEVMGVEWRFLSFQPSEERIGDALAGLDALGFRGVRLRGSLQDAAAHAEDGPWSLTERAVRTRRATHLTRHGGVLQADDAAGPALVEALATALPDGHDATGKHAVILGAGASARSVADVLVEQGAAAIAIADQFAERAAALVLAVQERVGAVEGATEVTAAAWEAGWFDAPDTIDWVVSTAAWPKEENDRVAATISTEVPAGAVAVDLGVGSNRSPLLLRLADKGVTTIEGLSVFIAETALVLEAWTGAEVDRAVLRDAAEEFLGL